MTTTARTFTVQITIPDNPEGNEFLRDIFITALEGGIGYWSTASKYRPGSSEDGTDWFATITDTVDGGDYRIDINTVLAGLGAICEARGPFYDPNGARTNCEDVPYLTRYVHDSILSAVKTLDAGEIDSDLADTIVQVGLFGKAIYG